MDTTTPSWIRRLASGARARWCLTATLLAAASLLLACGGGDTADEASPAGAPSVVTAIAVTPADSKIGVGLTQQLAAQARDQYGAVMSGVTITWTSSNPAVATVADGVVRGVSAGQTSITASSGGVTSAPAVLTATPVAGGRIVVDKASVFFTASGQTARLSASVFDAQGQLVPGDVRWSSSAPGQVSIDANGQVTALGVGSASLVAEASGVRSPPTLAIVAVPQPGTLLVADAQVVAISPLRAAPAGGADRYDATLRDFAVPPVGALLLAAETAPLAGRVVAARTDAAPVTNNLKTTSRIPSDNDVQAKVSAHFYVVAGLDATFFLGAVNAQIVEARIGPKQSFDLAFEPSQAALDGYASQYDLKLEGVIEPGAALTKAIEKVIGSDSTTVSFSAGFTRDISESPKGTLSVSAARVRPDAPLDFTVELAPTSSMEYWLLGYNVTGWQLYRKRSDELDFTPWKAMTQTASNRATYRWVPTEADAGTYEFAAFVNTQLVTPLLEVAPDSRRTVEVSCFSGGSAAGPTGTRGRSAALAAAPGQICADTWAGDVTYIAKTPGLPTANIATKATITWVVDPARSNNLSTSYKATGRFELAFNHPDACVSKLVPNSFAIVDSPITPSTLTLFHTPLAPPSYGFGGAQLVDLTVTVSCPGRNDVVTELRGFLVNFAYGTGPLAANQATLAGSIEDAATTATWNFNRP